MLWWQLSRLSIVFIYSEGKKVEEKFQVGAREFQMSYALDDIARLYPIRIILERKMYQLDKYTNLFSGLIYKGLVTPVFLQ